MVTLVVGNIPWSSYHRFAPAVFTEEAFCHADFCGAGGLQILVSMRSGGATHHFQRFRNFG